VAETLPLPPDLAETIEACLFTIAPDMAATLARNPRSTITPAQHTPDPETLAAVALLQELGPLPGAKGALDVEGTLGEGGMGVVRLATQRSVGRKVALKTLRDGAESQTAKAKLLHEGWTTGALEHPNVVPVYDVGTDDKGTPFIVLKRIEGDHWGIVMCDAAGVAERFGVEDLAEWNLRTLLQVCNAVHFAHSRGIVHRDLKPENVMIGRFGEVYVVDWGIAVSLTDDEGGRIPSAKRTTRLAGTPCYMAPETLNEEFGELSERTDVYLLGAILFEILTGRPPHEGKDLMAIFASVLVGDPVLPESVPPALADVCLRALARRPEDRFESAEALRLAIQDYLSQAGSVRLAARAESSLAKLQEDAARVVGDAERAHLYDLLGECRFGFRSALAAWSGNEAARTGLAAAVTAMTEYELARGDARAAKLLVAELDQRSSALAKKVDHALVLQEEREKKEAALRDVGASLDPTVGRRTRVATGVIMGGVWTVAPIVGHHISKGGHELTSRSALVLDGLVLAMLVGLFLWARESLTKSVLNKRVVVTLFSAMGFKLLIDLWILWREHPAIEGLLLAMLAFAVVAAISSIHLGWKLLPVAVGYLAVFVIGHQVPGSVFWALFFANLLFTLCIVWIWLPNRTPGRGFWGDGPESGREG
jgi:serine/threonine-protein kinase